MALSKLAVAVKQWVEFSNAGVDRMGEGKTLCKSIKEAAGVVGTETVRSVKWFEETWHKELAKVVESAVDQRHGEEWTSKRKDSLKRAYKARLKTYLTGVKPVKKVRGKSPDADGVEGGADAVGVTSARIDADKVPDIDPTIVHEAVLAIARIAGKYKVSASELVRCMICNS